jgi:hypothetical protein
MRHGEVLGKIVYEWDMPDGTRFPIEISMVEVFADPATVHRLMRERLQA